MRAGLIAATLGLATPAAEPVVVVTAQPAAPVDPATLAKANRLVEAIDPLDGMLAANMADWEHGFREGLKTDPAVTGLETEHPGVIKAVRRGRKMRVRKKSWTSGNGV